MDKLKSTEELQRILGREKWKQWVDVLIGIRSDNDTIYLILTILRETARVLSHTLLATIEPTNDISTLGESVLYTILLSLSQEKEQSWDFDVTLDKDRILKKVEFNPHFFVGPSPRVKMVVTISGNDRHVSYSTNIFKNTGGNVVKKFMNDHSFELFPPFKPLKLSTKRRK